jgi:hypothetical protein
MTAISTAQRPAIPAYTRKPSQPVPDAAPRQQLEHQAAQLLQRAARAAQDGDTAQSARLILEALDCERRSGGSGPQVLQLIKPRG